MIPTSDQDRACDRLALRVGFLTVEPERDGTVTATVPHGGGRFIVNENGSMLNCDTNEWIPEEEAKA